MITDLDFLHFSFAVMQNVTSRTEWTCFLMKSQVALIPYHRCLTARNTLTASYIRQYCNMTDLEKKTRSDEGWTEGAGGWGVNYKNTKMFGFYLRLVQLQWNKLHVNRPLIKGISYTYIHLLHLIELQSVSQTLKAFLKHIYMYFT